MEIGWLILAAVLKIAFAISVLLLLFAPVLVLAERRQSAMMQDRVGPYLGGPPMPRFVLDAIPALQVGAFVVAALMAGLFALSLLMVTLVSVGVLAATPVLDSQGWGALMIIALPLAVVHFVAGKVLPHLFVDGRLTMFGALHSLADALKCAMKEDFVPGRGDRLLHSLAPIIAMIPVFATFAVVPFGPTLYIDHLFEQLPAVGAIDGPAIALQVADLNVGMLFIFAIAGTGIIGAAIAGYSSDSKFALLGGLRAASQMVSYEVTLGLSIVPIFMIYGSLRLPEMIEWQSEHLWGIVVQPLAFILFLIASIAEYKRVPFDAPEGESEIVAGYFLEYSGMKWLMYMMGEFVEIAVSAAIISVLFLGGWDVPFMSQAGWEAFGARFDLVGTEWAILSQVANSHLFLVIVGITAFLLKMAVLCFLSIQIRWTLPRFRYDQIMQLCWKGILPLSLLNILITGIAILAFG